MIIRFKNPKKPDLNMEIHEQMRSGEFIDFDDEIWKIVRIVNKVTPQSFDRSRTHDCIKIIYVEKVTHE